MVRGAVVFPAIRQMKFTRLRLVGFKSFCDATELVMEPGLTGVVGPNGCGKSNLVEAMRWVMGESSYKAMRAAGMDEVIFSGSHGRPGRNSAEVTLVLDNTDRTAPAALNHSDTLEVTRRIERESGSVYRVNSKEVRARDVQLLFADASTGAHSPALVRQGQIGELIAAKPTQRRALLEEAAGISGLHSRRHEAELRLRAAETNLERVDDIIGQVESQLETLRRQARLASRYRSLSGEIRRAEALLFHIRWVGTRVAEKEAEAEQARLIRGLAEATHAEHEATKRAEAAEARVAPLRIEEASAGAALQRLQIAAEQLVEDARRTAQRRAEQQAHLGQIDQDIDREAQLAREAEEVLSQLVEEAARLTQEGEAGQAERDTVAQEAEARRAESAAAEAALQKATETLASISARRQAGQRTHADAAERLKRIESRAAEIAGQMARVEAELAADTQVQARQAELAAAQEGLAGAEAESLAAEQHLGTAQAALDAERPRLQDIEARLAGLEAEAATLAKLLQAGTSLWPAVADELVVAPGYETALGAALGDDLEASSDAGAPVHWSAPLDGSDDPPLPQGAEPLSRHVKGSAPLKRRLDQIGLIDKSIGTELVAALKPGQRLVTLEGDLWRWDGFVSAAEAPSAAAIRLAQRNRLAEADAEISRLRAERNAAKRDIAALTEALDAARTADRHARESWRAAQQSAAQAQAGLERARRALGELETRKATLDAGAQRLADEHAEAQEAVAAAEAGLVDDTDETAARAESETARQALAQRRQALDEARSRLSALDAALRLRADRLAQIERDTAAWQRRRDGARAQAEILATRRAEIAQALAALPDDSDGLAERQAALDAKIEEAKIAHKAATDSVSVAGAAQREAATALRQAVEAVAAVRIDLGRIEERLRGSIAQRQQIETQIGESLGIAASRTLEAAGLKPHEALPPEPGVAQKLDRLKAERERLGGVNLSAEAEAEEAQQRLDTMVRDRDDLLEAIAKLRQGIQALNREGRARLTEAFAAVNAHFSALFTTLFGGGTAELTFVESDDPLEAGLEIIARPPGKKPQTMTLLSGGEQALTALSLIFAVFLTNPAPICVLDEVDAPLDDANVERFCDLLDDMRRRTDTRFLVVTHNPITMSRVDRLFGVTQAERGVSQLVSVDLTTAESFREAV
jgi:chromosome segregation protein